MGEIRGGKMMFEFGECYSFNFIFIFLYAFKKIRQYDTNTYFDGMDGTHASITHDSGGEM